ncbi:MAG: hypothetical protein ABI809_05480 [Caldimonas sp.]
MTEDLSALTLTVHTPPAPEVDAVSRRTASGRLRMLLVLLVCAAPVVASYIAYFVIRPERRNNYSELIAPPRPLPAGSTFTDLQGHPVAAGTLKGQWLLVVVAGGACDAICERHLWIQRQLRESLGRDSDRVDKVWLIDDAAAPRRETLDAVREGSAPATVLRAPPATIARWLEPAPGARIEDHIYIVDPRGEWMMRVPRDPDPARLKRDIEKLLRASTGWDRPGR